MVGPRPSLHDNDDDYPHMLIGKVWIYRLRLCVCVFVRLRISPLIIKLAASNFARQFIGLRQGISHFCELCSPRSPKSDALAQRAGHAHPHLNITVEMRRRKRHARDALFVKTRGVWT